ncbi:succinate semialdehyde dehydrogenase NADP+ linked [Hanseniaspora osmophila]|uniref:Succinate-semialdehyde dehydrogenase n=1 Tax=Hanseniaspora osmophila TaxID=56408 RepID=A0A1E5R1R0_9ASCO|nr:Succinate-semialdehyde dehydrogenase [NADP(+)] [Hanseniaspora osmophila]
MSTFEYTDIKKLLKNPELIRTTSFVNGQWTKQSDSTASFKVTDPGSQDNKVIAELPDEPLSIVDFAIESAYDSFKKYKNTTPRQRASWLRTLYNLMMENAEDLAVLVTLENGKSFSDALGEIKYGATYFEWFAEEAPRLYGHTIQPNNPKNRVFTRKEPVGVVGIICPWNFPSAMITRKAAAALAVGCTVVVKPDSQTPLSALALAYLVEKAGFPKGSYNTVLSHTQTPEFGLKLCEDKRVKKITFTGSTNVGKILMKQAASSMSKVSFELGGNAPFIVFEDCDLKQTVDQAIAAKFRGLGQTCVCANKFYVQKSLVPKFTEALKEQVLGFNIGHGLNKSSTHGSLINDKALEKTKDHVKDAVENHGAEVVIKGGPLPELGPNFYSPTVLTNVSPKSKVCQEETFGPLCAIVPFETLEEVVAYSNDCDVGLASYVFSKNIDTIFQVSEALESGMVSCNTGLFSDCAIPFGGVKESGFGREGSLYGVDDYTVIKTITIGNLRDSL